MFHITVLDIAQNRVEALVSGGREGETVCKLARLG